MKKATIVITLMVALLFTTTAWADTNFQLKINGKDVVLTDKIIVVNGRTLLPFRAFFELVGATVEWDAKNRVAIGRKGTKVVKFPIGKKICIINNKISYIDVGAQIINGKTYVPIRKGAESLGFKVDYKNRVVYLSNPDFKFSLWSHPSGYFSLNLGSEWKIEPITPAKLGINSNSSTVVRVLASKGDYTVQFQHYPAVGLSDDVFKKALSGELIAQGIQVNWSEKSIGGKKVIYSLLSAQGKSALRALVRQADIILCIDIANKSGTGEGLMSVLESAAGAFKSGFSAGSDPTGGKTMLVGKWSSSSSSYNDGLYNDNSFSSNSSFTFYPDGTMEYNESSSFDFSGVDYGGAYDSNRVVAYYRVLGDVIYFYNDLAVVNLFGINQNVLQIGTGQYMKSY